MIIMNIYYLRFSWQKNFMRSSIKFNLSILGYEKVITLGYRTLTWPIRRLAASLLVHQKEDCDLCLFTDASDTHWGGILTQVPPK